MLKFKRFYFINFNLMKKFNTQQKSISVYSVIILSIWVAIASPWFDLSVSNHSFVKTYVAGIGIGILAVISLWIQNKNNKTVFNLSYLKLSWLSLFLLGTLSVFWSVNVDFTITKWMIWFTIFCSFIVGYHLKLDNKILIKLSWGLLIAAFVVALIGILQYLFDPFTLTQAAKPASTFGNKNMTTQPIVLIWPIALFLLFSNQIKANSVWVLTLITSLMMVFIFYTKTRSSWLSIIGEIILISGFLVIKRHRLKEWISWDSNKTKAVLVSVVLFAIMINFNDKGFHFFSEQAQATFDGAGGSGKTRFIIWEVAIDMIKSSPIFGTGLGSWFQNEMQGGFGVHNVMSYQRVHNDFLEVGVETGTIGMILLLIAALITTLVVFKIIHKDNKSNMWFYFLLWVGLSGSFVQMQFSFPYQLAMPSMLLGLYLGFIAKRSEEFIQPVKAFSFKTSKAYYYSVRVFWVVLMIVVSSIYMQWANTYSHLNHLNSTGKIEKLHTAVPPIYHLELQNIFGFLGTAYLKASRYDTVVKIEEQALKYWPDANGSLYRYSFTLMKKKHYHKALEVAKHLQKVSGRGYYKGHFMEMEIYKLQGKNKKFMQTFKNVLNEDKKLLSLEPKTYELLLQFSLSNYNLYKYSEQIYKNYVKNHPYNCRVENNIASYYVVHKKYQKAKQHVDIIQNSNNKKCLKTGIIETLKKQGIKFE